MDNKFGDRLIIEDFREFPIWEFANDLTYSGSDGELVAKPIVLYPLKRNGNILIGTDINLANGRKEFAMLSALYPNNPELTRHCLQLVIFYEGNRFFLSRYFDWRYSSGEGPADLASFLGLTIDQVFPISYDISRILAGHPDVLKGTIEATPNERLPRREIFRLMLEELRKDYPL